MAQLISPHTVKIVNKDGGEIEVHVKIDLNLNLTTSGVTVVGNKNNESTEPEYEPEKLIPDFTSANKVKFGKKD